MRLQKDGMTPVCSVATLLAVTYDLLTHKFTRIFHRRGVNRARARFSFIRWSFTHEQTEYIVATQLVWTVVIINGSRANGPLTNGRALELYS